MNVKICKCKLAFAVLGLSLGVCVQVLLAGAQQDSVPSAAAGRIGHADVVGNCKNVKVNTRVGQLLE